MGAYRHPMGGGSETDFLAGVLRLRLLLPAARAAVQRDEQEVNEGNPLGGVTLSHITEANMAALLVYEAPQGGWHADLVLEHVPPGLPNALGSPKGEPYATRAEADKYALKLLTMALIVADSNKAAAVAPSKSGVFLFHNFALTLKSDMLALVANSDLKSETDFAVRALKRVEALLPENMTAEDLDGMSHKQRIALHGAAAILALAGIYAWPLCEDAPPLLLN